MEERQGLARAADLLQRGLVAQAKGVLEELAQGGDHSDILHLLGLCRIREGQLNAAEKLFERAYALTPSHPHLLANMATLARRSGRSDRAVEYWKRAVRALPSFAQAWYDLGLTELALGRSEDAAASLQRACDLNPTVQAWQALGNAKRSLGELGAAESAFRNAISLDDGAVASWVNLGAVLRLQGRAEDALSCYQRAMALGDNGPELYDALAGALQDTGRLREAIEIAQQLVRDHPTHAKGQATLAHLLWEYGAGQHPADALEAFRQAADLNQGHLPLQIGFASILVSAGQTEEAADRLLTYRSKQDRPELMWLHAEALDRAGRLEDAAALYSKLVGAGLLRDPRQHNAYIRHLLKTGRWREAADEAIRITAHDPDNQEAWAYLATAWRLLSDPREFWLCDYERLVTVLDVPPPHEYAKEGEFLSALRSTLDALHTAVREPMLQSLRSGSQTPGRLFGRPDPILRATEHALRDTVEHWLASLPAEPEHPFLRRHTGRVRYAGSWSVKLRSSGHHVNHIHPEGWISSAYYVALPSGMSRATGGGQYAGCLQLGAPLEDLGLGLAPRRVIRPRPGQLVLFPSYMWHGTVPFEDAEPRMTIAFDLLPVGSSN